MRLRLGLWLNLRLRLSLWLRIRILPRGKNHFTSGGSSFNGLFPRVYRFRLLRLRHHFHLMSAVGAELGIVVQLGSAICTIFHNLQVRVNFFNDVGTFIHHFFDGGAVFVQEHITGLLQRKGCHILGRRRSDGFQNLNLLV